MTKKKRVVVGWMAKDMFVKHWDGSNGTIVWSSKPKHGNFIEVKLVPVKRKKG